MQIIGILLVLLNVGSIAAPMAGIAVVYQDNLEEIVLPPQITDMINNTVSLGADPTTLVEFVDAEFDNVSRTITLTVDFTNPLDYALNLKLLNADVQCAEHDFNIGQMNLAAAVELPATVTTRTVVICTWTESAENHFRLSHSGESTTDVNLMYLTVNVNDITIQLTDPVNIPDLPIV